MNQFSCVYHSFLVSCSRLSLTKVQSGINGTQEDVAGSLGLVECEAICHWEHIYIYIIGAIKIPPKKAEVEILGTFYSSLSLCSLSLSALSLSLSLPPPHLLPTPYPHLLPLTPHPKLQAAAVTPCERHTHCYRRFQSPRPPSPLLIMPSVLFALQHYTSTSQPVPPRPVASRRLDHTEWGLSLIHI